MMPLLDEVPAVDNENPICAGSGVKIMGYDQDRARRREPIGGLGNDAGVRRVQGGSGLVENREGCVIFDLGLDSILAGLRASAPA